MMKKSLRNIFQTAVAVAVSVSLLAPTMPSWAASAEMERTAGNKSVSETGGVEQYDSIDGLSDEILYDTSGNRVRCCGGEVHQYTEDGVTKWYWFGEEIPGSSAGSADAVPALHLYSSTDLYNWTREGDILKGMTSKEQFETDEYFKNLYGDLSAAERDIVFEFLKNCPTAHPKMLYHASKQQYVMWMTSMNGKACITTSNSIKGPFKFVKYCEDMSSVGLMYQDSDGSAYAFYNNGGQAVVAKLTDDYMGIDGNTIQSIGSGMVSMVSEGGMFERDGKYYMVNAGTGQYAMADSLTGSWSLHSLQMCDDSGQVSQIASMNPTSCVFRVNTENGVEYVNMSDKWTYAESDSERYIWLPLKFSQDGTMALRKLSNWKLDGIVPEEPVVPPTPQEYDSIDGLSGEILYDTDGERVYACGGEVHQFTENGETKWYWFGVDDLEMDGQKKHPGIHLYSSTDLYNWKHEGTMDADGQFGMVAHPKVLYNEQQHQYVMWVSAQSNGITRTIVATSNSIKGPFTVVEGAGGGISGFINLYQDSTGEAYLLSMGTGGLGLSLARLSDDYTAIVGTPQPLGFTGDNSLYAPEGGIFERNGKYYIVNAGSPDSFGPQYAVADSLSGPWTLHSLKMWDEESQGFEDIVKKNQTSDVFHVKTDKIDTYVCVGDSVGDLNAPGVVRHIWLPIKFLENDEIALEKLSNWKLDGTIIEEPVTPPEPQEYDSIDGLSGEILYDTDGERVYACGGEVHQFTENGETKWYWFGVDDLVTDRQKEHPGIHLYSSTDLYNWKHEGTMDEDGQLGMVAHPKVLYNEKQHQYVMWVSNANNEAIVATSSSIKGPFTTVEGAGDGVTGFINLYQDRSGEAYLLFTGIGGLRLAKLSDDYTAIDGTPQLLEFTGNNSLYAAEGGIFERNGKYYIVNAGSPDSFGPQYAVADSLSGPWTLHKIQMWDDQKQNFENIVKKNQTSNVFHVKTDKIDTYVCVGDSVNDPTDPEDVRYIWLPIKFLENDEIALEKLSNWKLDGTIIEEPVTPPEPQEYDSIDGLSGEILYDTDGERVYACGGEVHQFTENGETKWYWFGVDDLGDGQERHPGIHLYSSTDLYNWKHEGTMDEDGQFGVVAHPKVLYNEQQHQYVMWVSTPGNGVIVATSNSIKGPFTAVEGAGDGVTGFINLYQDSAGEAYLLSANARNLSLAKLSDDYTAIDGTPQPLEFTGDNSLYAPEGGIFERNGKYYIVNAGSPDSFGPQYAVADSLSGSWTLHKIQMWDEESQGFEDIVSKNQTSDVFHVKTDKIDTYVCVGDSVGNIDAPEDVRYIWLPIKFLENDEIALEKLSNWKFEEKEEEPPVPIEVTEVKLTETSKTLKVEEEYQINATVLPANAENRTLTYKSGDETVATVSASGKVLAKEVGNTTITVTSANGKKAELKLTVEEKEEEPPAPIEVTEIRLTERSKTLKVGDEYQITAVVLPADAEDQTLTYVSSDETVAMVSNSGKVQATKAGTTTITVTSANGTKAELKLTVEEKEEESPATIEVTEVKLTETSKTLKVGEEYQINATALPADAENRTLTYKSGDETVATVSNGGKVLARKVGSTTITVTSANGKKAELQLKVEAVPVKTVEVQSVLVSTKKLTVGVGEKVQLEAGVYPRNASDRKLTYKPSNNKVEVSKKGRITAKKTGDCKITISASNGEKAVIKVTVKKKPGKVSLNAKKKTLKAGKKFQIKPKLPKGTASYNITYVSNSKSVAVVDKNGKVTAKKKGNAVITVKTYNGKKAILKLRVK